MQLELNYKQLEKVHFSGRSESPYFEGRSSKGSCEASAEDRDIFQSASERPRNRLSGPTNEICTTVKVAEYNYKNHFSVKALKKSKKFSFKIVPLSI